MATKAIKKAAKRRIKLCRFCKRIMPEDKRPNAIFCSDQCRRNQRNRDLMRAGLCRACGKPRDPNSKVFCTEHLEKSAGYKRKG